MEKWDLYKLGLEQFREHPRIYWTRNTFFVIIQSALIAFAAFDLKDPTKTNFVDLVLAFVGLVIALVWLRIAMASRELLRKWRQIVLQLESELFDQEQGLFQRSTKLGEGMAGGVSITAAMLFLAVFFVFTWFCLVTYIGLQLMR